MKKKYINPEIKTIELLSNIMMQTTSNEAPRMMGGSATDGEVLSTGRRAGGSDWADPWSN